jgi:hypothetical protein
MGRRARRITNRAERPVTLFAAASTRRTCDLARHGQLDRHIVAGSSRQTISGHGLDHRPILPEACCGVVNVRRLHLDAASLSAALVRYLKMERVGYCLGVGADRLLLAAHLVSPLSYVGLGHFSFTIWPLARRVRGAVRAGSALDYGLVLGDDAKAFFTTAENFDQLHVSEPSSQCADFDRSTGRFAAEGGAFLGVNTSGGPTG